MSDPKKKRKPANRFMLSEVRFIRQHTKDAKPGQRLTAKKLALKPEMKRHTWQSIATIIKKFGFADPVRSKYIKSGKPIPAEVKAEMLAFLQGEGRLWPTSEVAKRFNVSLRQTGRFRARHKLQIVNLEEAMSDLVYRAWYDAREKKRKSRLRRSFVLRPARRAKALEKVLAEFLGRPFFSSYPWVKCTNCGTRWPKAVDFFRTIKRKDVKGQIYTVIKSTCLACPVRSKRKNTAPANLQEPSRVSPAYQSATF